MTEAVARLLQNTDTFLSVNTASHLTTVLFTVTVVTSRVHGGVAPKDYKISEPVPTIAICKEIQHLQTNARADEARVSTRIVDGR